MLSAATGAYAVELLRRPAELASLVPQWQALAATSRTSTVFQQPEWLLSWWSHFGNGQLRTLTVYAGRDLVGLVPLYWANEAATPSSVLRFLGAGISDHLDGLFAPGHEVAAATTVLARLGAPEDWDMLTLDELPAESALRLAPAPSGWTDEQHAHEVCPFLPLPPRGGSLFQALPADQRQRLAYYRRRAARVGQVSIRQADHHSLAHDLDTLFRLHALRWQQRGTRGVLAERRVQAFHLEAAERLLARGMLRLWTLAIGGHVCAVLYAFSFRQRCSYYISGFDPAFRALSPGLLVVGHALESAHAEGCTGFDFLRGSEPYKHAWGAIDEPSYQRILRAPAAAATRNPARADAAQTS